MIKKIQILKVIMILSILVFIPTDVSSSVVSKTQAVDRGSCVTGEYCKLLAYWTFDGSDIVNGVVKDMSATTTPSNGILGGISTTTFYTTGKLGQALNFDGVDDSLVIGVIPALYASSSDMTVSMWIKPSKLTVGSLCLICNSNAALANVPWALELNVTAARFSFGQAGVGGGTVRITNNTNLKKDVWYHVVAVRTFSSTLSWPTTLYLNGVADGSGTLQRAGQSNQTVVIGRYGAASVGYFQGVIDDVRVYNRALSAIEVKQLYNNGASRFGTSRSISSTTTCTDSLSCGLMQFWTFNGKDILNGAVLDSAGGNNRGSLFNISTTTFYTAGKIGQALNFDGVNDYLRNSSTLDLTSTNVTTVSFWAKNSSFNNSDGIFLESSSNYNNNDGSILFNPNSSTCSGQMLISIQDSVTTSKYRTECFNRPSAGVFHNYTVIYDNSTASGDIRLFIDGVEQTTQSTPDNTKDQSSNLGNQTWYFMSRAGSSLFNSGVLDEVYIYNRALSTNEILKLYNSGVNKYAASPAIISSQPCLSGLSCGLVAYWTFNGKDLINGFVKDRSENNKNGNVINISTTTFYTAGKIGQAFNFDGVDDYVDFGNVTTNLKTVSFWIKAGNINKKLITLNATTHSIEIINGTITPNGFASPSIYINGVSGSVISADKWYHVVITTDTGVLSNLFYIGRVIPNYFLGSIDDVRVYNRVLSPTEIKQLYYQGR